MKPGTVFVLSVALAALVASMVYRQLHARDVALAEVQRARTSQNATVSVVVAKATLPIGTKITAEQLTTIPWVAGSEPEGAVSDPAALVGRFVIAKIDKNHPVSQSDVAVEGASLLPMMIPEGMRAISVKIDTVTGVSGFVTPGTHVDVLVASGSRSGEVRSKLFLQNVKVLALGKSTVRGDDNSSAPTVTLLVTPEQAEQMTLASRFEPVQLALRSFQDQDVVSTQGASSNVLFAASLVDPATSEEEPAAPVVPEHRGYTVEVLLGGKSTRQAVF